MALSEHLDLLLFAGACALVLAGYPVAFSLAGAALLFAGIGWTLGIFDTAFLGACVQRIFGTMTNEVLIAVPLFIFMGTVLERSRVAEDLLESMNRLFGARPGGLGVSVCIVGAMLAASTGIVGATVVTMGLISLPVMLRHGYDPALASGSIAAAGTLGQIIPPSIVLVLLGDVLSSAYQTSQLERGIFAPDTVSVGDLFAGALLPGLMLVGLYIVYLLWRAWRDPASCPGLAGTAGGAASAVGSPGVAVVRAGVPGSVAGGAAAGGPGEGGCGATEAVAGVRPPAAGGPGEEGSGATEAVAGVKPPAAGGPPMGVWAPVVLIVAVLGSILAGAATPTEAAALGAGGAVLLAGRKRGAWWATAAGGAVAVLLILVWGFDMRIARSVIPASDGAAILAAGVCLAVIAWGLLDSIGVLREGGVLAQACQATTRITSMVFVILIGAAMFSLVFRGLGGDDTVHGILAELPGGAMGAMIVVMALMFVLGFFLDFVEIIFIVVPLVAPPLMSMGLDPVWLGVMMAMNLQTSFLTPPFGFALFYLRGVAPPQVRTGHIYRGAAPFVGIQILALALLILLPGLATWLPSLIFG